MHTSLFGTQRGIALVVSLVMLVAITLIGVFVMNSSRLEWMMSSNSRFQSDAGIRTEAALRDGENTIVSTPFISWDITPGFYNSSTLINTKDPRKVSNWSNFTSIIATTMTPARYIVEYLKQSCLKNLFPFDTTILCTSPPGSIYIRINTYRVWALASDNKGTARIAQSTYRKIDNPNPALIIGGNTIPTGTTFQRINYAAIKND